jgi:hypothetical protein
MTYTIVLDISEVCMNIVSHMFDPEDVLAAHDIYALRLASRSFNCGLIDVVTLRSIRVWWIPPDRPQWRVGSMRPVDARPQFDARDIMSGVQLSGSAQRWMVKEMRVETYGNYDHTGQYPFGGNRLFLAELVARFRSCMGDHVEGHTMCLVIGATFHWDFAMISGITESLVDMPGIHIECKLLRYFSVFTLDGPAGLPAFRLSTIENDSNLARTNPILDILPQFACDSLVWDQPRYDSDLLAVLNAAPRRLRSVVIRSSVGAQMVASIPVSFVGMNLVGLRCIRWELEVEGDRLNVDQRRRIYHQATDLTERVQLLAGVLARLPSQNGLQVVELALIIGAPFYDRPPCSELCISLASALRTLAGTLSAQPLQAVLLRLDIKLRPSRNAAARSPGDFTPDGLRLPDYTFRPVKEMVEKEMHALKGCVGDAILPKGRHFDWSLVSTEKSIMCRMPRERYWEMRTLNEPWNLDSLLSTPTSPRANEGPAAPPRFHVVRAFNERRLLKADPWARVSDGWGEEHDYSNM